MLYQDLSQIESARLAPEGNWLLPAILFAAGMTAALLLLVAGAIVLAALAILAGAGAGAVAYLRAPVPAAPTEPLVVSPDYTLLGSALSLCRHPVAITNSDG